MTQGRRVSTKKARGVAEVKVMREELRGEGIMESLNTIDELLKESEAPAILTGAAPLLGENASLPHCELITGSAGTGKTTLVRQRADAAMENNQGQYVLAATTGIAAVNMGPGVTTIHSLLGFFDVDSMEDRYMTGGLQAKLNKLIDERLEYLVLEECSMFEKVQTDLLVKAMAEANDYASNVGRPNLKLMFVGDFCQLPPVGEKVARGRTGDPNRGKFAFEADCWTTRGRDGELDPKCFAANITRLGKIWRQDNPAFIQTLNAARAGDGRGTVNGLHQCGVLFEQGLDKEFVGTTLIAVNKKADRYNDMRLAGLPGQAYELSSYRWLHPGEKAPAEWRNIPIKLLLKENALVMVLVNEPQTFAYVNGDQARVIGPDESGWKIGVELYRTGQVVEFRQVCRPMYRRRPPEDVKQAASRDIGQFEWKGDGSGGPRPNRVHFDVKAEKWVVGAVTYYPLRLAWGTTIHKSQGLTLDRVQIDTRDHFFSNPAMAYVAMSRCKTAEGLRMIGSSEEFAKKVKVAGEVGGWV